jgi:hypothetical protein
MTGSFSCTRLAHWKVLLDVALPGAPLGNVFDCQQDRGVGVFLVEDLTGIQLHRAPADAGKIPLNLVCIHHRILWRDVLQQQPKLGDIPLTVAKRIKGTAFNLLPPLRQKCQVERAVCGVSKRRRLLSANRSGRRLCPLGRQSSRRSNAWKSSSVGPGRYGLGGLIVRPLAISALLAQARESCFDLFQPFGCYEIRMPCTGTAAAAPPL